ncbi:hypothetical protein Pla111_20210 [Botrimarina hoheduenensis]|uniref:DUF1570 domain-containing protein n=2 Tax=Botrimarina hoheduenensis TaxID=2528000 RepID=A0A5C5WA48_9BACT|nr:hypothetical protein Pla111_20210 [Botrimarina hoheduenensis]
MAATVVGGLGIPLIDVLAVETFVFREQPFGGGAVAARTVVGQVLLSDSTGGVLLDSVDGGRYLISGDDVVSRFADDAPFTPVTAEGLGERLLEELPPGFRVHTTEHYVIAYDTSREYAEWASSLLESLQEALVRYWTRQGLELHAPRFPLGVVIHRSAEDYQRIARAEIGTAGAVGYYSMRTNRVRMFDLTGSDEVRGGARGPRSGSRREITQMLSVPAAEPLVATIVHEATHQVAFNTGVMQRFADLPLWLVEGMAVYFEAPNAGSSRGWRGIGKVNRQRLVSFRRNLPKWNRNSLTSLIGSDLRLRDARTAADAYADAWALNYFLIQRREEQYVAYVKTMADKKPLEGPEANASASEIARDRLAEFVTHFGPLPELEQEFLRTMSRLK